MGARPPVSVFCGVMFNESMSETTDELMVLLKILGLETVKGASML
jgi:hypothetical protein